MQFNSSNRMRRGCAALAAATAAVGFAPIAFSQTFLTTNISQQAQVEPGEVYNAANGATQKFFDLEGATNTFKDWGILQFSAPSLTRGTTVSSVNSDLSLTLAFDSYTNNTIPPTTLSFYLTTDTTTPVTSTTSTLNYEPAFAGGFDPTAGDTGTFAKTNPNGGADYQIIPLGTAVYSANTGTVGIADGTQLTYNLTLNATAESFIQSQINSASPVNLIIVNPETDGKYASWYGSGASSSSNLPTLKYDVTTTVAASNSSLLYAGTTGTSKAVSVNVGKQINILGTPTYCVLAGATTTAPVTIYNGSSTPGASLAYTTTVTGGLGSGSTTSPGPEPIAPGASAVASIGFSGADTTGEAGSTVFGTVDLVNQSNTSDADVVVTENNALVLQERFVDSPVGTQASPALTTNIGKVLAGKTGTAAVPLTTTNPVVNPNTFALDYSHDALTDYTLNANATSTPFVVDDPFSGKPVGTISASNSLVNATNPAGTAPGAALTFDNTETYNVAGNVQSTVSGTFGNDVDSGPEGSFTAFNQPNFTTFAQSTITGDGLAGESDSIRAYLQWQAYEGAAVTGNSGTLGVGAAILLSNAASDDNIYTYTPASGPVQTYNNGLRATAWVTGASTTQDGWSITGYTFASGNTAGSTVAGPVGASAPGTNSSGTVAFNSTNKINGTYTGTVSVLLENEQDIQGAAANDVTPVVINVQTTVSSQPSIQSGTYTLKGGGYSNNSVTNLTGTLTFTQSATPASFAFSNGLAVSGNGKVIIGTNVTLGSQSVLPTPPTSNINITSLSITGNGTMDINNNHIIIDYAPGQDPIASIAALIVSGFNATGVPWTGTGITSTAALNNATSYGIGYADSADPGNPAGLASGQIEVMYTLLGDANLDGKVNGSDFAILATNFNKAVSGWDAGDFNYDGKDNGADFTDLAANFNKGSSQSAVDEASLEQFAAANGLLANVPEPASMGLLAISGISLLARRKRRVNG